MKQSMIKNVSEIFVETLRKHGVRHGFGIVGSAFMVPLDLFPLAGIRWVSVQHEENAVFMADAYSRISSNLPVVAAQNGPGVTNMITGVASAKETGAPMFLLTPESASVDMDSHSFQELDTLKLFQPVVKMQRHLHDPQNISKLTSELIANANILKGPVQFNVPRNMFFATSEEDIVINNGIENVSPSDEAIAKVADVLSKGTKIVILAGGGCMDSTSSLQKLAEKLNAPVVTSFGHNDAFDCTHPLHLGPLGYNGSSSAMDTLTAADVILAVGTKLRKFTLAKCPIHIEAKVVHVDANPMSLTHAGGAYKNERVSILSDADAFCSKLAESLPREFDSTFDVPTLKAKGECVLLELERAQLQNGKIAPRSMLRILRSALPTNVIATSDIGNTCAQANAYLTFVRTRSMLAAGAFGSCGYAIPAALGAKLAAPDRPVVALVGDGAFAMGMQELLTSVREKLPITVVLFKNNTWGAEKLNAQLWFGNRELGTSLKPFDVKAAVNAFGCDHILVEEEEALDEAIKSAFKSQETGTTTVVEVELSHEFGEPFRRDAMKAPVYHLERYKELNNI